MVTTLDIRQISDRRTQLNGIIYELAQCGCTKTSLQECHMRLWNNIQFNRAKNEWISISSDTTGKFPNAERRYIQRLTCSKKDLFLHMSCYSEFNEPFSKRQQNMENCISLTHLIPLAHKYCPVPTNDGMLILNKLAPYDGAFDAYVMEKCLSITMLNIDPILLVQPTYTNDWWLIDAWE